MSISLQSKIVLGSAMLVLLRSLEREKVEEVLRLILVEGGSGVQKILDFFETDKQNSVCLVIARDCERRGQNGTAESWYKELSKRVGNRRLYNNFLLRHDWFNQAFDYVKPERLIAKARCLLLQAEGTTDYGKLIQPALLVFRRFECTKEIERALSLAILRHDIGLAEALAEDLNRELNREELLGLVEWLLNKQHIVRMRPDVHLLLKLNDPVVSRRFVNNLIDWSEHPDIVVETANELGVILERNEWRRIFDYVKYLNPTDQVEVISHLVRFEPGWETELQAAYEYGREYFLDSGDATEANRFAKLAGRPLVQEELAKVVVSYGKDSRYTDEVSVALELLAGLIVK